VASTQVIVELAMRRALGRQIASELAREIGGIGLRVLFDPFAEERNHFGLGAFDLVVAAASSTGGGRGRCRDLDVGNAHHALLDLAQHGGSDRCVLAQMLPTQHGELAGRSEERAQMLHLLVVEVDAMVGRALGVPAVEFVLFDAEFLLGPLGIANVTSQASCTFALLHASARHCWRLYLHHHHKNKAHNVSDEKSRIATQHEQNIPTNPR
jgi:hypothetical protein